MQKLDFISLTLESTKGNILRTFLSIISVIIGVFSFVFVVSLNEGMAENVLKIIEKFGGYNTFNIARTKRNFIRTKNNSYSLHPITNEFIDSLKSNFPEIIFITEGNINEFINDRGKRKKFAGLSSDYFEFDNNIKLKSGRIFNKLDHKNKNLVAIVGANTIDDKFSNSNYINIKGYQFEIIGEYEKGIYRSKGFTLIPLSTLTALFGKPKNGYRMVKAKVYNSQERKSIMNKVKNYLKLHYGDGMFLLFDSEETIQELSEMSTAYSNLILLFSILMLVTGGIGIMNIMLSSIRERMREIGIKKAVGARNKDIFIQFFLETFFLFFIGGTIGLILAIFSVESAAEFIIKKQMLNEAKAIINFRVIIISIVFTGITGFIFGLLPAIKASKVMPIDSLRYE